MSCPFSPEVFVIFKRLSTNFELVSLVSILLASDWISCSEIAVELDLIRLKVLLTAFDKFNAWFGFFLRSFRIACCLGMPYFVRIRTISVPLLNIGHFLDNAWWSAPLWQRCCFKAHFHYVPISVTCLATHLSFEIFLNFSFCLFFRDLFESRWFFFFESQ